MSVKLALAPWVAFGSANAICCSLVVAAAQVSWYVLVKSSTTWTYVNFGGMSPKTSLCHTFQNHLNIFQNHISIFPEVSVREKSWPPASEDGWLLSCLKISNISNSYVIVVIAWNSYVLCKAKTPRWSSHRLLPRSRPTTLTNHVENSHTQTPINKYIHIYTYTHTHPHTHTVA